MPEFEARIPGLRLFMRNTENLRKRVFFDVRAIKSQILKHRLNQSCQRVASIALKDDVEVVLRYISSIHNPADTSSKFE